MGLVLPQDLQRRHVRVQFNGTCNSSSLGHVDLNAAAIDRMYANTKAGLPLCAGLASAVRTHASRTHAGRIPAKGVLVETEKPQLAVAPATAFVYTAAAFLLVVLLFYMQF